MANPQKENGFTPIANEILESLARTRIPGEARQVLDVVIRKTYGFHKKQDAIALSQFCLATGLKKVAICKAIVKLKKMNLIIITQKGNGQANIIRFNKDFDTWELLPKKVTLPKKVMAITQKGNEGVPKKVHTKDSIKDTITKDNSTAVTVRPLLENGIYLFKSVNPSYELLFKNKTERASMCRLLEKYGEDKVKAMVASLQKFSVLPGCPQITTPYQLEKKLGQYVAFIRQQENKTKSKVAFL